MLLFVYQWLLYYYFLANLHGRDSRPRSCAKSFPQPWRERAEAGEWRKSKTVWGRRAITASEEQTCPCWSVVTSVLLWAEKAICWGCTQFCPLLPSLPCTLMPLKRCCMHYQSSLLTWVVSLKILSAIQSCMRWWRLELPCMRWGEGPVLVSDEKLFLKLWFLFISYDSFAFY